MAIEAVTQMNSDSANPVEIYSFDLRKVSIKAALVVPDHDGGVETLFALRYGNSGSTLPAKDSSRQWYTFSVSSVAVPENIRSEHATGIVGVNLRPRSKCCKIERF